MLLTLVPAPSLITWQNSETSVAFSGSAMTAGFASDVGGSVALVKTSWLFAPSRHTTNSSKTVTAIVTFPRAAIIAESKFTARISLGGSVLKLLNSEDELA